MFKSLREGVAAVVAIVAAVSAAVVAVAVFDAVVCLSVKSSSSNSNT